MPNDLQIAEALLAVCLHADHKPGKIQFTKYLYLLDYCHWRFTGRKATALPWRFYHFGPWCEEAESCMATLAERHSFRWRDDEFSFVRSVELTPPPLDLTTRSLIEQIVEMFRNRDLNVLLEVTYSQTEPMVAAKRGDTLDFSRVPVERSMPVFFPSATQPTSEYQLHPERRRKMEAFRARAEALREKARQRMVYRESDTYQQAISRVAEEFTEYGKLPEMRGSVSLDAADGLATE